MGGRRKFKAARFRHLFRSGTLQRLEFKKNFYDALPRVCRDLVAVGRKKLKKNNLHTYRQRGKQGQVVYKTEG